jgi:hypothetical protein
VSCSCRYILIDPTSRCFAGNLTLQGDERAAKTGNSEVNHPGANASVDPRYYTNPQHAPSYVLFMANSAHSASFRGLAFPSPTWRTMACSNPNHISPPLLTYQPTTSVSRPLTAPQPLRHTDGTDASFKSMSGKILADRRQCRGLRLETANIKCHMDFHEDVCTLDAALTT